MLPKTKHQKSKLYMLSNCLDTSMTIIGKIDGDGNPEKYPAMIRAYNNQHMGGADCLDQQLHAIHLLQKHIWYKEIPVGLLSLCMLNPFKLLQVSVDPNPTFLSFMHVIIQLTSQKPYNHQDLLQMDDSVSRLSGRHFISRFHNQGPKIRKRKRKTHLQRTVSKNYLCLCVLSLRAWTKPR